MLGNLFSGWHVVILVALVLLLFGATKLPALAKSLGESVRILRKETNPTPESADADRAGEAPEEPKAGEPPASDVPSSDVPSSDAPGSPPPQRD